ncbi:hydantoinase/oxoprolinase family protein [Azospirillum sp. RWY-5-1]|uniref:Hydantoinase/oxoprolinase family protein n=1 Tax=Azospirillum oleiclasticum TaxID=2735135 RepID=A0ABX2TK45_9PROT|nr:hydantoinase/oxoprolinase family protein [Azospirillum oleiclasticum]NYZ23000.1 hydantoinase/oxoprolinase family protein [Azospirillum oleiclasticum]
MGFLVSIDNGGTLTDVCATDGAGTIHVKTITTPHDLTECFIKGLEALSERVFGEADLGRMIAGIDHIRYSTTQGTNAIVQRKGPRIGLLTDSAALAEAAANAAPALFEAFVGGRVAVVPGAGTAGSDPQDLVMAVSGLVSAGTNRVVVALSGAQAEALEQAAMRALYRAFPRHLLGAVPLLFSTRLSRIGSEERRLWAALVNAFLHPAMERFLYNAENSLRDHRARKPLLIFGNDGTSTRVAKTVAIKTYSSGPQGGVVGAEVLAAHYGIRDAVTMDIGGTTTDIAVLLDGRVAVDEAGAIEGAPVPIPLARILSIGAGGGSIIRVVDGAITVGPESVGAAPGPACFGRGGTHATITDALLVQGVLDPAAYFGGRLTLDVERAERAVRTAVAEPLGLTLEEAVTAMVDAYDARIAAALRTEGGGDGDGCVLMAFGGAGPMSACGVAEKAGLSRVLIPRFAAVFSAFGISFSDIRHTHLEPLAEAGGGLEPARAELLEQARRGMLAEGFALDACRLDWSVLTPDDGGHRSAPLDEAAADAPGAGRWLALSVVRPIDRIALGPAEVTEGTRAEPSGERRGSETLPLYRLENLAPGEHGAGPCLVEEAFFTTRVKAGWRFTVSGNGDLFLTR